MTDVRPDPRPAPSPGGMGLRKGDGPRRFRHKATRDEWEDIAMLKLGPCYVCSWLGLPQKLRSTLHHIVSKSLGGDDSADNAAPLCGTGTTGHHGLVEAHDEDTCRAFAAALQQFDDSAYANAVEQLGEDGFLKRYKVDLADGTAAA